MRKILIAGILFFSLVALPASAAVDIGAGMAKNIATGAGYDASTDALSLSRTVGNYIKIALSLVGMIFLVLTVYAGFLWMTASGEEEKMTKSKEILRAAVIGLAITLMSYGITTFVVDKLKTSAGMTGGGGGGGSGNVNCCFYYTYTSGAFDNKSWFVAYGKEKTTDSECNQENGSVGACFDNTVLTTSQKCWRFLSNISSCGNENAPGVSW